MVAVAESGRGHLGCAKMGGETVQMSVAHQALAMSVTAGVPVVLWGSPGTGKTSVVRSLGESLGWPVEVVVGSIREPTDFAGLPVVVDGDVRLAPPVWAAGSPKPVTGCCSWTS